MPLKVDASITPIIHRLGEVLREVRILRNLTLDEAGARTGVDRRTIKRLETGSGGGPTLQTFLLLVLLYEVDPGDVLPSLEEMADKVGSEH